MWDYYCSLWIYNRCLDERLCARFFACTDLLLAARISFHFDSWSLCKCSKPWCRVVGVQRTPLAVSATQAALDVLAWLSPDGTAG